MTRKNAGGSRNEDSARLAARIWTVTATAEMAGLNVLTYLTAYLDDCGRNGGKPLTGPDLERFLPWNASPDDLHAWATATPHPANPTPGNHHGVDHANRPRRLSRMPSHRTSEYLRPNLVMFCCWKPGALGRQADVGAGVDPRHVRTRTVNERCTVAGRRECRGHQELPELLVLVTVGPRCTDASTSLRCQAAVAMRRRSRDDCEVPAVDDHYRSPAGKRLSGGASGNAVLRSHRLVDSSIMSDTEREVDLIGRASCTCCSAARMSSAGPRSAMVRCGTTTGNWPP